MTVLTTIRRQLAGFAANVRDLFFTASVDDLLPPSVVSTLVFIRDSVPRAFGFTDTPTEHITGIVVFSVALILGSFTTLTVVAVVFALVALPMAALRLWPAVDERWPFRPRDWPFWEVQT